jgi:glycosyltransferase involved in cell wall biosynthesis
LNVEQVDKMLSISDVYVMPSVSEPFGISSLEALDAGVPIIISNQSGAGEVIESALKVDFWDVDAMADAINALLHYKPLSKILINRSDGDLKHLTWDEAARKVLTTYRQMLDVKA